MHAEDIKSELRKRKVMPADIARQCEVTPQSVSDVIHNKTVSQKIRSHIAKTLGKSIHEIWPKKETLRRSPKDSRDTKDA